MKSIISTNTKQNKLPTVQCYTTRDTLT